MKKNCLFTILLLLVSILLTSCGTQSGFDRYAVYTEYDNYDGWVISGYPSKIFRDSEDIYATFDVTALDKDIRDHLVDFKKSNYPVGVIDDDGDFKRKYYKTRFEMVFHRATGEYFNIAHTDLDEHDNVLYSEPCKDVGYYIPIEIGFPWDGKMWSLLHTKVRFRHGDDVMTLYKDEFLMIKDSLNIKPEHILSEIPSKI